MPALSPARCGLAALLALVVLSSAGAAEDDASPAGSVSKVENQAEIVSASGSVAAVIGTQVHMKDELRTGAAARLQVTFRDDTVLTLGENASVVIDAYVFDPEKGVGETVLKATQGAFRFATGRIKELGQSKISIVTPAANIGVRGTEFWGGPIDEKYGVLLLKGEVVVANEAGTVTLSASGQGTNLVSSTEPPSPPSSWPEEKVARAIATVTLH